MVFAIPTDTCFWFACNIYDFDWFKLIYQIKERDLFKPLSFVVNNYSDLHSIIDINQKQIEFLKSYLFPFTVIWNKIINFQLPGFLSELTYSKIAIRVASNCLKPEIINDFEYPMFLTSVNISWEPEIFDSQVIIEKFWFHKDLKIYWWSIEIAPPSDIFEFDWDSTEINYYRKNSSFQPHN